MKKLISVLIFASLISGCAFTKITSIKAPQHSSYKTILAFAKYSDIGTRKTCEDHIKWAFAEKGVAVLESIDIYSPLKTYSDSEMNAIRRKMGIDIVLSIDPNGTSTTTYSESHNTWYGGVEGSSAEDLSGIYTIATMIIPDTEERIYQASIATSLGKYASIGTGMESLARNLADDLLDNNFITPTQKPTYFR